MGEQANGPVSSRAAGSSGDQRSDLVGQVAKLAPATTQQVAAADPEKARAAAHEAAPQEGRQLLQVKVEERHTVPELTRRAAQPAVPHEPEVERGSGHATAVPASEESSICSATRRALLTPSSWKPQPQ